MPPTHALTVIADPRREKLGEAVVSDLRRQLDHATELSVLSEGEAFDLLLTPDDLAQVKRELAGYFHGKPYDWAVLPLEGRKKRLLVSDMDSTIIQQECLDELADFAGMKQEVSAITEAAMNGLLDFKAALRERVALLKGMDAGLLERAYAERIRLMKGARTLLATMKANGAHAVLVSGGFTFFTSRVAADLGFDEDHANLLLDENGTLTGMVADPILDKDAKEAILRRIAGDRAIPLASALAVGDGANDLPMLKAAGLGVAYHAKALVKREAQASIDHGDLTALLFLQGYPRAAFVDT